MTGCKASNFRNVPFLTVEVGFVGLAIRAKLSYV